jgi:hypothetical protein
VQVRLNVRVFRMDRVEQPARRGWPVGRRHDRAIRRVHHSERTDDDRRSGDQVRDGERCLPPHTVLALFRPGSSGGRDVVRAGHQCERQGRHDNRPGSTRHGTILDLPTAGVNLGASE